MTILLAFAPFVIFAVINRIAGPFAGLIAGAVAALLLLARDWLTAGRSLKILDIGSTIVFAALVVYSFLAKPTWSVVGVRLCVDAGLLLIVLVSLAVGRPFTLQYAREQVRPELWDTADFKRTNYVITGVWALAFAAMVIAEFVLLYVPAAPDRVGVLVIILALVGAVKFTGWYPEHVRTQSIS